MSIKEENNKKLTFRTIKYPIPVTHNKFVANLKIAVSGSSINVRSISTNDLFQEEILIKWKTFQKIFNYYRRCGKTIFLVYSV